MQIDGFFAVSPKTDCPHVGDIHEAHKSITVDQAKEFLTAPCIKCADSSENWICLVCGFLGCSRYVNQHMKSHCDETGHCLAISFSDLSCWCYSCDSYIVSPAIRDFLNILYLGKFGRLPPTVTAEVINCDNTKLTKIQSSYPPPQRIQQQLPNKDVKSASNAKGHLKDDEIQEYLDSDDVLEAKLDEFAQIYREANKVVTFTGAGISTSAKIPDYRGPQGVWTLRDRGEKVKFDTPIEEAQPTFTHRALKAFTDNREKPHFIVSTNVDGLHRKSGVPADDLSELHGNIYCEECCCCQKTFYRNFAVSSVLTPVEVDFKFLQGRDFKADRLSHRTGRKCDCGGYLCDNIINFGEAMPIPQTQKAVEKTVEADLAIVLGTSMRVAPANKLPELIVGRGGKMVIVNLQKTPYDDYAAVRIFAPTDKVMEILTRKLQISVE